MKIFLWLALGFLVFAWVMRGKKPLRPPAASDMPETARRTEIEAMNRCAQCGVYHPASESIVTPAGSFCSEEHRRLHG
ncbi:MAG: hypothetical protein JWQ00_477 [Noviherbaspirillum sp.]|nr:hypothetical protein [Noviherbaspirillum sp.]